MAAFKAIMNKFPEHRYKSNVTKRSDSLIPISFPRKPLSRAGPLWLTWPYMKSVPGTVGNYMDRFFGLCGICQIMWASHIIPHLKNNAQTSTINYSVQIIQFQIPHRLSERETVFGHAKYSKSPNYTTGKYIILVIIKKLLF